MIGSLPFFIRILKFNKQYISSLVSMNLGFRVLDKNHTYLGQPDNIFIIFMSRFKNFHMQIMDNFKLFYYFLLYLILRRNYLMNFSHHIIYVFFKLFNDISIVFFMSFVHNIGNFLTLKLELQILNSNHKLETLN